MKVVEVSFYNHEGLNRSDVSSSFAILIKMYLFDGF